MTPDALSERYAIGALYMLGRDSLRTLLGEHFGGKIPQPGTGAWIQFVFATALALDDLWLRTYAPQVGDSDRKRGYMALPRPDGLPRFPKALEAADHFLPYEVLRPRNTEAFWIGFWSCPEQRNPYHHPENCQAYENGRALARTREADIYRRYVEECRKALRQAWGEKARLP